MRWIAVTEFEPRVTFTGWRACVRKGTRNIISYRDPVALVEIVHTVDGPRIARWGRHYVLRRVGGLSLIGLAQFYSEYEDIEE